MTPKTSKFYRCSTLLYLIYILILGPLFLIAFHPKPSTYLKNFGKVGNLLLKGNQNYLLLFQLVAYGTLIGHVLETLYVVKLSLGLGLPIVAILKWTLQTFILGFPSVIKFKELKTKVL